MDAEQRAIAKSQRTLDDLPAPVRKVVYRVVEAPSRFELEPDIERFLKNGWQLEGGIAVYFDRSGKQYVQAMSLRSASEAVPVVTKIEPIILSKPDGPGFWHARRFGQVWGAIEVGGNPQYYLYARLVTPFPIATEWIILSAWTKSGWNEWRRIPENQ